MRKALFILGSLNDEDVEWIARNASAIHVDPGTEIISAGRNVDALYIVLDGQVSIRVGGRQGKEIARLYSGEIVGEMSFVDERPPEASVVSEEQSQLLVIPVERVRWRMDLDEGFSARFYKAVASFLADRLRVTTSRFGYGHGVNDLDRMDVSQMDETSVAAIRFDRLLRRFRDVGENM